MGCGGNSASTTKTMDGVDLAPGETFTFTFSIEGFATSAYNSQLGWDVTFRQKGGSSLKDIMKKAKFTGQEYNEFLQKQAKDKDKSGKKASKK